MQSALGRVGMEKPMRGGSHEGSSVSPAVLVSSVFKTKEGGREQVHKNQKTTPL